MNIENMKIWRDFLISNELPFEMRYFRSYPGQRTPLPIKKDEVDAGINTCGTAGCAIGWAPFVIPPLPQEFNAFGRDTTALLNVNDYVQRVFGLCATGEDDSYAYGFITDMNWTSVDNTRLGAAFRINCVIDGSFRKYAQTQIDSNEPWFCPDDMVQLELDEYQADKKQWIATLGELV